MKTKTKKSNQKTRQPERMFTALETAEAADCSYQRMVQLFQSGEGPEYSRDRFGRYQVSESCLREWLASPSRRFVAKNLKYQDRVPVQVGVEAGFMELLSVRAKKEKSSATRLLSAMIHTMLTKEFRKPIKNTMNEDETIKETIKRR